ncbi:MAG: NosD domain-containing protein [Nitrososphaeria archaeon]
MKVKIKLLLFSLATVLILASAGICDAVSYHYGVHKSCNCISNRSDFFSSIQEAINKANDGDVVLVPSGVYFENVIINKSILLKGESPKNTIIDGGGRGAVIRVIANNSAVSGFNIRNGLYGFEVIGSSVSITFNNMENNYYGALFVNTELNNFCRNNVSQSNFPIVLRNCHLHVVANNNFNNNYGQAISLYNSKNNTLVENNISNNPAFGIYLEGSVNNIVKRNNISSVCQGIHLNLSDNNTVIKNFVANTGPYAIILNLSNRNKVYKNQLTDNEIALQLSFSHSNLIVGNNIAKNKLGLYILCSSGNILKDNAIKDCAPFGNFGLYGKELKDFLNDIDITNSLDGAPVYYLINQHNLKFSKKSGYIALVNSSGITVENLNLSKNYQAITLAFSSNITLRNLQLTKNFQGIYMINSYSNIIEGCTFKENIYNFYIHNSSLNKIFHNNFLGGGLIDLSCSKNFWDKGYPSGGNYWSEFKLQDKFMGPYQNITGFDGISDSSINLYSGNLDRYPLIAPVKIFRTEFSDCYFIFTSNSTILNFQFKPEEGPYVSFSASGSVGSIGFCRVSIPKEVLWAFNSNWRIVLDNYTLPCSMIEDEDYTYLSFYYNQTISIFKIYGTDAIPEFANVDSLFLITILIVITFFIKLKKISRHL